MIWYATGGLWIFTIFFWGLGLTLLLLPRRWRRFWPAFCGPVGLGLQSLTVWIGAHTPLAGTDRYAWPALLLPIGLLLAAGARVSVGGSPVGTRHWGKAVAATAVLLATGLRRWAAVAALMAASLVVQCYPFTKPPGVLTSAAISSCDAADYAAGARVLKEFSRDDREGFLGPNGADPMLSTDHFFTFWLRINHFSPPALIALYATLSGRQPYELVSLFGAVLLVLHLPAVCWLARSVFRFRPAGGVGVTAIYAFSPILYYTAYQTALGQLLAAPAVVLLTWTAWQAARGPATWRRLAVWSGLLLTGNWLLFGGYNFFILFAYIPVLTFVCIRTLRDGRWARTFRWLGLIGGNLLVCTLLFPERVVSIVERLALFRQTPFGWYIPGFWPTGWYGAFAEMSSLAPTGSALAGAVAVAALGAAGGDGGGDARRGHGLASLMALCCTLPIFCGYWYLLRAERLHHDRSSYDAFKLFTVFYPGILVSLCLWLRGGFGKRAWLARVAAGGLWAAVLAINLAGAGRFNALLRRTPLVVDPDLLALTGIEQLPDVTAVNVRLPLVWDRLWANCFLLRKEQYISAATYEGRPALPPRARWDLTTRLPLVRLDGARDPLSNNPAYTLLDRANDRFVEVLMDRDWHPVEHGRGRTWYWAKEHPQIRVDNPQKGPVAVRLSFAVHSTRERHLSLLADERPIWEGTVGTASQQIDGVRLDLPPGTSSLRFVSPEPPEQPSGDSRSLLFQLESFTVELPGPAPSPAR